MSSATWACFECRETVRRLAYTRAAVLCPNCGQSCRYLGHHLRMPPKRQAKAWREVFVALQKAALAGAELDLAQRRQRIRDIQQEIDRLESMGPNEGRAKQVRLLRRKIEKLQPKGTPR